jgi:alkaline phosphatase D
VVTFDDHEIENNWADDISQPDREESNGRERFLRLRANAFQAYYEHLPLRLPQRPTGPDMLLHRRLDYGSLATFHVLDTRQYRSDQLTEAFPAGPLHPDVNDPARSLTGDEQERWLFDNMQHSGARWNIVAQQTIIARVDYDGGPGVSVNHDQWDGYAVSRNRFLSFVEQARPSNPVVLTGDWHSAWVNDLRLDFDRPETPVLATELVGTSISSGCGWAAAVKAALPSNPHVKYLNPDRRGYTRVTVTPGAMRADYRVVASAADTTAPATTDATWVVENGRPGAVRD